MPPTSAFTMARPYTLFVCPDVAAHAALAARVRASPIAHKFHIRASRDGVNLINAEGREVYRKLVEEVVAKATAQHEAFWRAAVSLPCAASLFF